jgi:hypothetical protein
MTEADARQFAIDEWTDDNLSIDGDAIVSLAAGGAWVAAWVWVDAPEQEVA